MVSADCTPQPTPERERRAVTQRRDAARRALHSSLSVEWYTPAAIVEPVRLLLGAIDLDPASCAAANGVVRAARYYTREEDGLRRPWSGRVWLNPPYGRTGQRSNQELWSRRLLAEWRAGNVSEAVLLVNAATEATWFQALWPHPICFVAGRIRFWRPDAPAAHPTHGSALVYLGPQVARFGTLFRPLGPVVRAGLPRER